jgi:hypothetical protein
VVHLRGGGPRVDDFDPRMKAALRRVDDHASVSIREDEANPVIERHYRRQLPLMMKFQHPPWMPKMQHPPWNVKGHLACELEWRLEMVALARAVLKSMGQRFEGHGETMRYTSRVQLSI